MFAPRGLCPQFALFAALFASGCEAPPGQAPLFAPAPESPIAVADMPGNIALGDVNQDGELDLLVSCVPGMSVLLGQGDGRFRPAPSSPIAMTAKASEMALCDLNEDGKLDLALASHNSYDVTILLGNGKGDFIPAQQSPVTMKKGEHPHTHGLDTGDLNGDGHLDLVTVNSEDADVSLAFGDGKGGFTPAPASLAVGGQPYPGAVADLNGDSHLDIIATSTDRRSPENEAATKALTVLVGDGKGGFHSSRITLPTILPWYVVVADVNRDQKPDLVTTHAERNELTVLLGDGKGDFTEVAGSPFDLGASAWRMAVTDLSGDGKPDVAVAAAGSVRVLVGDGKGSFQPASGSPFAAGKGTWQLAVGDLNGDKKPDIAATNLESDTVTVLLAQ